MYRNRVLLLADLSNLAYRYSAAHATLTHAGTFTGGLYGFMVSLAKVVNELRVTRVGLCKDHPPYKRLAVLPEYKGDRSGRDPVLYANVEVTKGLIEDWCKVINVSVFSMPGYEADDWIALHAIRSTKFNDMIVAWSNDADLFQLFSIRNFAMYRGKTGLYTREQFQKDFDGISREHLRLILAMVGTHNAVPGIKGIGEVTAKKIVTDPALLRKTMLVHGEVIERNLKLIELPYSDLYDDLGLAPRAAVKPQTYDERAMLKFCTQHGITLTSAMSKAWSSLGDGE